MAGRLQKKVSFLYTWVLLGFFLPVFVVYIEENLSVILVVSFGLALIYQLYEVFLSFVRGEVVLMVYCFKNLYFSLYFSFYNFNLLWHECIYNFISGLGQLVSRKLFFILNKVTGIFANLTQRFYISLKGYLVYVQWLALGQMDIRDLSNLSLCSFPFFKSFNLWFFHILI